MNIILCGFFLYLIISTYLKMEYQSGNIKNADLLLKFYYEHVEVYVHIQN